MSMNFGLILIFIAVGLFVYMVALYNGLVTLKVRIKEAWSQIDVQLKRRIDLIPNLVETVRAYAQHEKAVFENVTKARSALLGATSPAAASSADGELTGALKTLFAVAEAYPELKAQDGFVSLQKELSDTEDKVAYSRQFYNSVVRQYNEKIVAFPANIFAKLLGFMSEEFFEASESEREPVKVAF